MVDIGLSSLLHVYTSSLKFLTSWMGMHDDDAPVSYITRNLFDFWMRMEGQTINMGECGLGRARICKCLPSDGMSVSS